MGTPRGVMVSELECQTITAEFESHWALHTSNLMLQVNLDR